MTTKHSPARTAHHSTAQHSTQHAAQLTHMRQLTGLRSGQARVKVLGAQPQQPCSSNTLRAEWAHKEEEQEGGAGRRDSKEGQEGGAGRRGRKKGTRAEGRGRADVH